MILPAVRPPRRLSVGSHPSPRCLLPRVTRRSATYQIQRALVSDSGEEYRLNESLTDATGKTPPVYRAITNGVNYIVKTVLEKEEWRYELQLRNELSRSRNVRTAIDATRSDLALFYPYFHNNLWVRKLPPQTIRAILRDALRGLADLHERGVVHNGLNPYNILFEPDLTRPPEEGAIKHAQIGNLEYAVKLDRGQQWFTGPWSAKNPCYRSPEAWCEARQNQASDIFSFGMIIVQAMDKTLMNYRPFRVKFTKEKDYDQIWRETLTRHLESCWRDKNSLDGFLEHIGERTKFRKKLLAIKSEIENGESRKTPFKGFTTLDRPVRDLVSRMTDLDPNRRISAREALRHPWFTEKETRTWGRKGKTKVEVKRDESTNEGTTKDVSEEDMKKRNEETVEGRNQNEDEDEIHNKSEDKINNKNDVEMKHTSEDKNENRNEDGGKNRNEMEVKNKNEDEIDKGKPEAKRLID